MSKYKELSLIVDLVKPKRYLEIGVDFGINLVAVDCQHKVGIDPEPKVDSTFSHDVYCDTSDKVFRSSRFKTNEKSFDLIFIDGLHEFKQVVRDVKNSLLFLNPSGVIVCHDVYPFDYLKRDKYLVDEEYPGENQNWTGDVWKTIFYVRYCMPWLQFYTLMNFPGYLWLQRAIKPRNEERKRISIDKIKKFSINYGIEHKNEMHIVSKLELIENVR